MVRSIVATARSDATRRRVVELGIADQVVETNAEAAKDADLVIVCIPVGASGPVAAEIAGSLKPGAIVSDVGSVKGQVLKDMAPHIPKGVHLVPAHPSPAPRTPVPIPDFPNCSSIAGASSLRRKARTRTRSKNSRLSGARSAPMSRS